MNTPHPHNEALDPRLDGQARALAGREPDAHAVEAAQLRLERRLAGRVTHAARPQRRRAPWIAFAATACAALALILVPFLVSERSGLAFAEVQRHFRDFRTLAMTVEQGGLGRLMPKVEVVLDDAGRVRTDVAGEISVVVDPPAGKVLMLMHGARKAVRFPVPIDEVLPAREALDWIEEIRRFQGIATALDETRVIDGQTAHGWSLAIGDARLQLWANDDGLPLSVGIGEHGEVLDLQLRFRFDVPVAAGTFSTEIPDGYSAGFKLDLDFDS